MATPLELDFYAFVAFPIHVGCVGFPQGAILKSLKKISFHVLTLLAVAIPVSSDGFHTEWCWVIRPTV
jgi:hypothetical protein